MITVYIAIGNSDDHLSQLEWHQYASEVDAAVSRAARVGGVRVHGRWYSLPSEPWQNACWCIEYHPDCAEVIETLRATLRRLAYTYQQDSIAWAEATTEFITAGARP
jgi:hypothetical protein